MISTCILTKDDEFLIGRVIDSVKPFVQEIIVIDDGSTDNTVQIAKDAGAKVIPQTINIPQEGFGAVANFMIAQATQEWTFIIDSDELLGEGHLLQTLTRYPGKTVWALPRRKWLKYPTIREEYEAYPDWQIRFFQNGQAKFEGHMHIRFRGDSRVHKVYRGPHIEHLQFECRTPEKEIQRKEMYKKLADKQGVKIVGGKLREVEK